MQTTSRREFLKRSAAAGAACATPLIWTRSVARGQDLASQPTIAAIGVGGSRGRWGRGGDIAGQAARLGRLIAVCDVDDLHTAEFNARFDNGLNTYRDYRQLFDNEQPDIVTIGTPDHWHVPIAIAALRADCDVYCEKPLTLTIDEGKRIRQVVEETGRVFQVGTQQRSEYQSRFLRAIALVRSGRLGDKVNAYLAIESGLTGGPFEAAAPPADLDWNLWLGPAADAPFSEDRRKYFRWFYEYSGGKMTDWGAHHIDIAMWALGHENSGPVKVSGTGSFTPAVPEGFAWPAYFQGAAQLPDAFNTATRFSVNLEFADGSAINVNDRYQRDDGTSFGNGILFEGDQGRIFVNRERLSGSPIEELTDADQIELDEAVASLYRGEQRRSHMRNFFDCVAERSMPVSDVWTHQRTMTACHLCNIALMMGREIVWDPEKEEIVGDAEAAKLTSRPRRAGFELG